MKFFNFGQEQKLDHHSWVKFHSDSDGNGFRAHNPKIDPQIDPQIGLNDPKLKFFDFGPEQKLDRHSCVEFHNDSDGDGFNFPKVQLNPPKCPLGTPQK